jgi:hypothetical protein
MHVVEESCRKHVQTLGHLGTHVPEYLRAEVFAGGSVSGEPYMKFSSARIVRLVISYCAFNRESVEACVPRFPIPHSRARRDQIARA